MLFASPSQFCLRRFLIFYNIWDTLLSIIVCLSSRYSQCFCSSNSYMAYLLSRGNNHELCSFCRFSGIIIGGPNYTEKDCYLCRWDECIRHNPSQNAAIFMINQAVALSSPVSTVYAGTPVTKLFLRTPSNFGMLFTPSNDNVSRWISKFTASKQPQQPRWLSNTGLEIATNPVAFAT